MQDKVFGERDRAQPGHIAVIGFVETLSTYAYAYLEAADALVENAIASHKQDLFFFPILYNYRHAAEIILKDLILETEKLIELEVRIGKLDANLAREREDVMRNLFKNGHILKALLDEFKARFSKVSDESIPDDITEAIEKLHGVDPNGEHFRYPFSRSYEYYFPVQTHFDLISIRESVSRKLFYLLFGCGDWLAHEIDLCREHIAGLETREPGSG